jgi:putative SOS response-associated peptidase YedK
MPVILPPAAWDAWLSPATADPQALLAALAPPPDDALEAVPVSRLVNSPHVDGPECLRAERSLFG